MDEVKVTKITMFLLGLKSLAIGLILIYTGIMLTPLMAALGDISSVAAAVPAASSMISALNMLLMVIWIIGILELVLGIFAILTAAVLSRE